jgi:hypothetical protein
MSMIDMNYQTKLIQPYYPSITEAPILDLHIYLIMHSPRLCLPTGSCNEADPAPDPGLASATAPGTRGTSTPSTGSHDSPCETLRVDCPHRPGRSTAP